MGPIGRTRREAHENKCRFKFSNVIHYIIWLSHRSTNGTPIKPGLDRRAILWVRLGVPDFTFICPNCKEKRNLLTEISPKTVECIHCYKKRYRERYNLVRDDPDYKKKRAAIRLKYNTINREMVRSKIKEYNRKFGREARLRKKYKITLEDYNRILKSQDGKCAICNQLPKDGKKLHVDHDHISNKMRQLLCNDCNAVLGFAQDSTDVLMRAIDYLIKHNGMIEKFEEEFSPG
jgi:hypothetical protein